MSDPAIAIATPDEPMISHDGVFQPNEQELADAEAIENIAFGEPEEIGQALPGPAESETASAPAPAQYEEARFRGVLRDLQEERSRRSRIEEMAASQAEELGQMREQLGQVSSYFDRLSQYEDEQEREASLPDPRDDPAAYIRAVNRLESRGVIEDAVLPQIAELRNMVEPLVTGAQQAQQAQQEQFARAQQIQALRTAEHTWESQASEEERVSVERFVEGRRAFYESQGHPSDQAARAAYVEKLSMYRNGSQAGMTGPAYIHSTLQSLGQATNGHQAAPTPAPVSSPPPPQVAHHQRVQEAAGPPPPSGRQASLQGRTRIEWLKQNWQTIPEDQLDLKMREAAETELGPSATVDDVMALMT